MTNNDIGPNQDMWLRELETTKKPQGQGFLCLNGNYCCIGIAGAIFLEPEHVRVDDDGITTFDDETLIAPSSIMGRLGLRSGGGDPDDYMKFNNLAEMNDDGMTFREIAAIIRANPRRYFLDAR